MMGQIDLKNYLLTEWKLPVYYQITSNTARGVEVLEGKITIDKHQIVIKTTGDGVSTWVATEELLTEMQLAILLHKMESIRFCIKDENDINNRDGFDKAKRKACVFIHHL